MDKDFFEQIMCNSCGGMKKLIINGKEIPEDNWFEELKKQDIMIACDLGCIC